MTLLFSDDTCGATFSPCRRYRYTLWRQWSDGPTCNFLMLNPSTADEADNDPTVERCERRARSWGYGKLVVTNLFALRSKKPRVLLQGQNPVATDDEPLTNDSAIRTQAASAVLVICAWGGWSGRMGKLVAQRAAHVAEMLRTAGVRMHCLSLTKNGNPGHPLFLRYELKPVVWEGLQVTACGS